ncbi:rhomboid family intramembrane serine protease [Sphingobacterium sp. SYP-B4668]|uniref:rhomboid family intramembrane serine protease n=1 Tax=Sphingobacterium sp. SYP-B4668 TaxID=2996035 RepID=UPI0022DE4FFC|nr:rhomboid family intramembrane serine protease [Sphingobacterium sp. SYP-B4668]
MDNIAYFIQSPVSSLIFILTIGLSIYTFSNQALYSKLMLHPYSIYRKKRGYTILTSGMIHKDWGHLLFNMITFYYFGFGLESIFVASSAWGHTQFAVLYLLSLVLSDIPTILQQKNNPGYFSLGASGAISAVLFGFILFNPQVELGIFMIIPMKAYLFAILFVGYSIWASKKANDGINHSAHLFGALAGLVITILYYPGVIQHFIGQF